MISCSSTKEVENIPADVRYQQAKELFDDESYLEAIEEFKIVIVQYQGSEFADDAQYYLAESRFQRGEYILAAAEYDNLIRTMPSSPFTSLSRYKKGLSHYLLSPKSQLDQKYTRFSIDDFQTYIEYSPTDSLVNDAEAKISEMTDRIARKIFESGKLYYRLDYYRASIVYFNKVISEYNDSQFTDDAMLWKARSLKERKEFDAASASLTELKAKYPATDLQSEIQELQSEIEIDKADHQKDQQEKLLPKNG
ncbi:MAG: outer membrane protein assembly factor BamD [Ignavibacteriales bacterium]|nr:outer membrane protein assembly factor BamD [Ignavibacteriales bacterium]